MNQSNSITGTPSYQSRLALAKTEGEAQRNEYVRDLNQEAAYLAAVIQGTAPIPEIDESASDCVFQAFKAKDGCSAAFLSVMIMSKLDDPSQLGEIVRHIMV